MPINTPQAKKPVVTSCSQSQGAPSSRVTTSQNTESVKPPIEIPHKTISKCSSGSSAFHLRWRWRSTTRDNVMGSTRACKMAATAPVSAVARYATVLRSLHVAHEFQDFHRVRSKFLGELVLDRLRRLGKAGFVDTVDHFHAHFL